MQLNIRGFVVQERLCAFDMLHVAARNTDLERG